jgi:hypothetical protein
MDLPDSALPGLYQAADQASLVAQRRYLFGSRLRLALVVAAAATGAFSWRLGHGLDLAAAGTVVALVGAIAVEVWLLTEKPAQTWYDGRALAESAKTMAWRFAVGGAPIELTMPAADAERQFVSQLANLLRDAPHTSIAPTTAPPISDEMRQLRAADLAIRKESYLRGRILDQNRWYAEKSGWNGRRALSWRIALLTAEVLGVIFALARAFGVISFDLTGVVAALIAAAVAWLAIKQHEGLERAYAYAANELAIVRNRLDGISAEGEWAREVSDAEEAISREHIMWRASRSNVGPKQ